jgi:hypothetical protein
MIRKTLLALSIVLSSLFLMSQAGAYNPLSAACTGSAANSPTCQQATSQATDPIAGSNGIINQTATVIALVAGVAAVIIIVISGISFITAAGNTESLTKARQRIIGAVIGLIVVALAWAIVRYVTDSIIK